MTGGAMPDPFSGHPEWELDPPRSIGTKGAKTSVCSASARYHSDSTITGT